MKNYEKRWEITKNHSSLVQLRVHLFYLMKTMVSGVSGEVWETLGSTGLFVFVFPHRRVAFVDLTGGGGRGGHEKFVKSKKNDTLHEKLAKPKKHPHFQEK